MTEQGGPVVVVDAGGTTIKSAAVSDAGEVVASWSRPTPRRDDAVALVLRAVDEALTQTPDAVAVGCVVAGWVDEHAGVAVRSENIGWSDVPFPRLIAEGTGLPVGFGHDVRAGGLAERHFGTGDRSGNTLFLPIGTGISGAMFVEGRFIQNMNAGELGHVWVGFPDACACGSIGCLEAVGSAAAIARRYAQLGGGPTASSAEVVAAADAGDAVAQTVWNDAVEALARGLVTYVTLLAPELIVLGGGVSAAGDRLVLPLRTRLDELLAWQTRPELTISPLGGMAGILGAAILAFRAADPSISKENTTWSAT